MSSRLAPRWYFEGPFKISVRYVPAVTWSTEHSLQKGSNVPRWAPNQVRIHARCRPCVEGAGFKYLIAYIVTTFHDQESWLWLEKITSCIQAHCLCTHWDEIFCLWWSLWGVQRGSHWGAPIWHRCVHRETQHRVWPSCTMWNLYCKSWNVRKLWSNLNAVLFLPGEINNAFVSNCLM